MVILQPVSSTRDERSGGYTKGRDLRLGLSAPAEVELLNLWRDFRKVVEFIDRNNEWLHPMLEEIDKNPRG